jgi:GT2 family glycosyltransferase
MVSVVVVNWNRWQLLKACLESLARQRDAVFEVIVVDNGSTDDSMEMLERDFPEGGRLRLKLIRNAGNRGFCAANNRGMAAAEGEFVALATTTPKPIELARRYGPGLRRARTWHGRGQILVHEDPRRIDKAVISQSPMARTAAAAR